jgi:hypothetical protein
MRATTKAWAAAIAATLLAPLSSRGHEDGLDARGTVAAATATEIVVTTADGERRRFAVTERTEVRRGSAPAEIAGVRVGERAVVHARKSASGAEAVSIRLPRAPPAGR